MPTVLFVCSANRFRSVIAEEQFRQLLKTHPTVGEWHIESAGTWAEPDLPPIHQALKFCRKRGWTVDKIRSRIVSQELLERSDLILTMTQGQQEALGVEFPQLKPKLFLLSEVCDKQYYDVSDPFENPQMEWDEVGNEVCNLVTNGFYRICRMAMRVNP